VSGGRKAYGGRRPGWVTESRRSVPVIGLGPSSVTFTLLFLNLFPPPTRSALATRKPLSISALVSRESLPNPAFLCPRIKHAQRMCWS